MFGGCCSLVVVCYVLVVVCTWLLGACCSLVVVGCSLLYRVFRLVLQLVCIVRCSLFLSVDCCVVAL